MLPAGLYKGPHLFSFSLPSPFFSTSVYSILLHSDLPTSATSSNQLRSFDSLTSRYVPILIPFETVTNKDNLDALHYEVCCLLRGYHRPTNVASMENVEAGNPTVIKSGGCCTKFCYDGSCSVNCGISIGVENPGCLIQCGRGSVQYSGSFIGTIALPASPARSAAARKPPFRISGPGSTRPAASTFIATLEAPAVSSVAAALRTTAIISMTGSVGQVDPCLLCV